MSNKVTITGVCTSVLPKLTNKESVEMLKEISEGNAITREKFILANMRLVLSMVSRFKNSKENPDDLFQVGMLGLMKAVDNFDVKLNVRFSTYAVPMVLGEIRRYVREGTVTKVGRNLRDIAYRAVKAREKLELDFTREASLTEIAQEMDVPLRDVVCALDAISEPISLYETAYQDSFEEGITVIDQIVDDKDKIDYIDRISLRDGLKALPEREKEVVLLRYYQGRTQIEIAKELQMSQAQVSRLEKSAIDKLKTVL